MALGVFVGMIPLLIAQDQKDVGKGEGNGIEERDRFKGVVKHGFSGILTIEKPEGQKGLKDTFKGDPNNPHEVPRADFKKWTVKCGEADEEFPVAIWVKPVPGSTEKKPGIKVGDDGKGGKIGAIVQIGVEGCPNLVFTNVNSEDVLELGRTAFKDLTLPKFDGDPNANKGAVRPKDRQFGFGANNGVFSDIPGTTIGEGELKMTKDVKGIPLGRNTKTNTWFGAAPGQEFVRTCSFFTFIFCDCDNKSSTYFQIPGRTPQDKPTDFPETKPAETLVVIVRWKIKVTVCVKETGAATTGKAELLDAKVLCPGDEGFGEGLEAFRKAHDKKGQVADRPFSEYTPQ